MAGSVSFDRAASFYDRTRGIPGEAMAQVVAQLRVELAGRGPVIEVGVGTGRIGLPLHQAGVAITGVDLSMPMMRVLVEKAGGVLPFPLVQGDATLLPFRARSFGAAVASHGFHLIPAWESALDELHRVLGPGAVVLLSGGPTQSRRGAEAEIRTVFRRAARTDVAREHGDRRHEVDAALTQRSTEVRQLPPIAVRREVTPAEIIDSLAAREWSWLWPVPDDDLRRATNETRAWAVERYGSLDATQPDESKVAWRAFTLR